MGEDTNAIEREIREKREQLGSTVDALEAKAAHAMDWREKFRENPKTSLAVAFGVGVVASGMLFGDSDYDSRNGRNRRTSAAANGLKTAILGILAAEARRYVKQQFSSRGSGPTAT